MAHAPIPVVDIGPSASPDTPALVDRALRNTGFLLITGHGIPAALPGRVRAAAREFFRLDPDVKGRYTDGRRGWIGRERFVVSRSEEDRAWPEGRGTSTGARDRVAGDPARSGGDRTRLEGHGTSARDHGRFAGDPARVAGDRTRPEEYGTSAEDRDPVGGDPAQPAGGRARSGGDRTRPEGHGTSAGHPDRFASDPDRSAGAPARPEEYGTSAEERDPVAGDPARPGGDRTRPGDDRRDTPPDLVEIWSACADGASRFPRRWPAEVPVLHPLVTEYTDRMRRLADTLLTVMAAALGGPADLFTRHTADPHWDFILNRYPAAHETGPAAPGQHRIGPHTDFGLLTLLDRQRGRGGLQVHDDVHGWRDAPWEPGAITLNIGDLMARWSGDRWRSGRHRVLPPQPDAPHEELTSLVYFHSCAPGTTVESLPAPLGRRSYAPVLAGEYLRSKMDAIRATE
ncbi:2OG-Fe(II) oxygenase family protein [Streptomyces sp. NPDC052114]|uniref:2OG-Fe(II) oxygenase family protein n=1 Tax=unclassified Streptomyces TaxID=2593676 RepID=UPI003423A6AC